MDELSETLDNGDCTSQEEAKDRRIIQYQNTRIKELERKLDEVVRERNGLLVKMTLLTYKLELLNSKDCRKKREGGGSVGLTTGRAVGVSSSAASFSSNRSGNGPFTTKASTPQPSPHRSIVSPQHQFTPSRHGVTVKRSEGCWGTAYELSQDLHDKQVEMLERKYGGHLQAQRAARRIQQVYRNYRMNKKFGELLETFDERRQLRRFAEFSRSKTIWTDRATGGIDQAVGNWTRYYSSEEVSSAVPMSGVETSATYQSSSEDDRFGSQVTVERGYYQSGESSRTVRVTHKSNSVQISSKDKAFIQATIGGGGAQQKANGHQRSGRGMCLDLSTIAENLPTVTVTQSPTPPPPPPRTHKSLTTQASPVTVSSPIPCDRLQYPPELNDSSASDSPHDNPVDVHIDLPSVNFENQMDYPETEALNDSFHSDSSHEATPVYGTLTPVFSPTTVAPGDVCEACDEITAESQHPVLCSQSAHTRTAIPIYGEAAPIYTQHPVYDKSEVRLRKTKSEYAQHGPGASAAVSDNSKAIESSETQSLGSFDGRSTGSLDGRSDEQGLSSHGSELSVGSQEGNTYNRGLPSHNYASHTLTRGSDRQRKRTYRVGLNLFNKKPDRGVRFLIDNGFIKYTPADIANFLIKRKGLSKQMIGEYLGNLQSDFNMDVLQAFTNDIDLCGMEVDMALRKFQSYFRMPGEAQKIERLMEAFASRYCCCNPSGMQRFRDPDSVFLLGFAIIMLNTDLHNRSIKPERKMKCAQFVRNLRGIDSGQDLDPDLLSGIYERIKQSQLRPSSDHVTQVIKVENMIVGKKPTLAVPHRRLVCYCRLYEVNDPNKKEKMGLHQREVFLFNDMLMVTKIFSKKKNNVTYSFRQSYPLNGMCVYLFDTPYYKNGIRLTSNLDGKALITFNARNDHDRSKFVEDLKEAISEMNEMDKLRINEELHKQRAVQVLTPNANRFSKDSGVVDVDMMKGSDSFQHRLSAPECPPMKKNTLSNSLIDISEGTGTRRNSGGSLDSGMASEGRGSQEDNTTLTIPPSTSGSLLFAPAQPYTKAMKVQQQSKAAAGSTGSSGGGGGRPLPPIPTKKK